MKTVNKFEYLAEIPWKTLVANKTKSRKGSPEENLTALHKLKASIHNKKKPFHKKEFSVQKASLVISNKPKGRNNNNHRKTQ